MMFKGCFPLRGQFKLLLYTVIQIQFYIIKMYVCLCLLFFPWYNKKVPKYSSLCKWSLHIIMQRMNQNLFLEGHGFAFVF